MTRLLCPDGCCDGEERCTFMNVQTLRMHLLHRGGDGTHPERTQSEIEKLIFRPELFPANNSQSSKGKGRLEIKKRT